MNRLSKDDLLGDRYRLVARIASGGMGDVWEAFDETLQRRVAVKVMRPHAEDEQLFAQRFRAEALHTAGLSHVNIATVFDYGEHEGLAYLVMELVAGHTLSELTSRGEGLPHPQVRSIVGQAALALAVAHDAGVVHRDVKPANIMVTGDGTVKLTDFGIARATDGSGHTRTGEVLGTPYYLSPEQALGRPATGASDLYSLGVVAHELITGRRPFDRGTPVATALSHVNELPPPLPADVPADLVGIVTRCLAKDPIDRPDNARVVAAALGFEQSLPVIAVAPVVEASEVEGEAAKADPTDPAHTPSRSTQPTLSVRSVANPQAGQSVGMPPEDLTVAWQPEWHSGSDTPVQGDAEDRAATTAIEVSAAGATGAEGSGRDRGGRDASLGIRPLHDLDEILANLSPQLHEGSYAIVLVDRPPAGVTAYMTLSEQEGVTMLLAREDADRLGLTYEAPVAWITLGVYRSIVALGFVPTLTTALYQKRIPAVATVGRFHTHLFVPEIEAEAAMKVLTRLSATHQLD